MGLYIFFRWEYLFLFKCVYGNIYFYLKTYLNRVSKIISKPEKEALTW